MSERSLELSEHETQSVTDALVRHADLILTMTRRHRETIVAEWPDAEGKTSLLRRDGGDISDPIGGAAELYVHCADQIDTHLRDWMEDIDLESIPRFKDTNRD
jgi:protein-tyrosine phosphatase